MLSWNCSVNLSQRYNSATQISPILRAANIPMADKGNCIFLKKKKGLTLNKQ